MTITRRALLAAAGTVAASDLLSRAAGAQSFPFTPNQRYPDPAVQIVDPAFAKYRIYSSTVEQVATGDALGRRAGLFPRGRLFAVLRHPQQPNHEVRRDTETSVFRSPANYANGNARDRQGRLVTCEHSVTRRITRTEKDGEITVLADKFEGKRLNAPNDIAVKSDDSIWFTDPRSAATANGRARRKSPNRRPPTSIASPRTANSPRFSPISSIKMALHSRRTKEALCRRVEGDAQSQHLEPMTSSR